MSCLVCLVLSFFLSPSLLLVLSPFTVQGDRGVWAFQQMCMFFMLSVCILPPLSCSWHALGFADAYLALPCPALERHRCVCPALPCPT